MSLESTAAESTAAAQLVRELPSVDKILRKHEVRELAQMLGERRTLALVRAAINELRVGILAGTIANNGTGSNGGELELDLRALDLLRTLAARDRSGALTRVINATGVVLHTNLGRAPLPDAAVNAIAREAAGYCTVEFDIETGTRGRRGARVDRLLAELTGAEDATVVNNCSAAVLLVLSTLCAGGETIVSRGELVEIGGDFRVPDVMAQAGTRLVEVGTTNRTKISDYQQAINADTRMLMKVHQSNFRIVGFTSATALDQLAQLAQTHGLPLYEDAGSGALIDMAPLGVAGESLIAESIRAGASLVSFSGDKLMGSVQAGMIVGRGELISKLRRHPLYRALRPDKLVLAALEATLDLYARGSAGQDVPALAMISMNFKQLEMRTAAFVARLKQHASVSASLTVEIATGYSTVGGGAAPVTELPAPLIHLDCCALGPVKFEQELRRCEPPIIARIVADRIVIDLRTVAVGEEEELLLALTSVIEQGLTQS